MIIYLILLTIYIVIPTIVVIFFFWILNKLAGRRIALFVSFVVLSLYIFHLYTEIYPADDFYRHEFKDITGLELKDDAIILNKDSSYPLWHNDYCSAAIIELSPFYYSELLKSISENKNFDNTNVIGSEQLDKVTENINTKFKKTFSIEGSTYKFIGFLNDDKTIIIHKCVF
jgi:hypothetical protein